MGIPILAQQHFHQECPQIISRQCWFVTLRSTLTSFIKPSHMAFIFSYTQWSTWHLPYICGAYITLSLCTFWPNNKQCKVNNTCLHTQEFNPGILICFKSMITCILHYSLIIKSHFFGSWNLSLNKTRTCLTHCGLVTSYGDKHVGQHWLR